MKLSKSLLLTAALGLCLFASCEDTDTNSSESTSTYASKLTSKERKQAREELDTYVSTLKTSLPQTMEGSRCKFVDAYIEDGYCINVYEVDNSDGHARFRNLDIYNDRALKSHLLNKMGTDPLHGYANTGYGIKWIYRDARTGKELATIDFTPEEVGSIYEEIQNGQASVPTYARLLEHEFNVLDLGVFNFEGQQLKDVDFSDGQLHYHYLIQDVEEPFTEEELSNMKAQVVASKTIGIGEIDYNRAQEEGMAFVWHLYNASGDKELGSYTIYPNELI